MAQYSTDFSEYTTGAAPSDWTERWTAGTVLEVRAGGDVGSKHLFFEPNAAGTIITWNDIDADANRDVVEVLMAFKLPSVATRTNPRCGAVILGNADRDGYFGGISDSPNARMLKVVNNTETTVVSLGSQSFAISTLYWFRMARLADNTCRFKVWADGDSEPGTWNSTTDSAVTAAGWVGIYGSSNTSDPEVHYFAVGTNGDSAPSPGGGGGGGGVPIKAFRIIHG